MPLPKSLTPFEAARTLAHRLAPRVDRLRQFSTRFGVRPYRVFLIWTRFGGEERGEGDECEVKRIELLPTPKVVDLTGVQFNPYSGGILPVGSVRIEDISVAAYNEDTLRGKIPPAAEGNGLEINEPFSFFWELVSDGRNDQPQGSCRPRQKYRLVGHPYLHASRVQYAVILESVSANRTVDGIGGEEFTP